MQAQEQFIVNPQGERVSVILPYAAYQQLLEIAQINQPVADKIVSSGQSAMETEAFGLWKKHQKDGLSMQNRLRDEW